MTDQTDPTTRQTPVSEQERSDTEPATSGARSATRTRTRSRVSSGRAAAASDRADTSTTSADPNAGAAAGDAPADQSPSGPAVGPAGDRSDDDGDDERGRRKGRRRGGRGRGRRRGDKPADTNTDTSDPDTGDTSTGSGDTDSGDPASTSSSERADDDQQDTSSGPAGGGSGRAQSGQTRAKKPAGRSGRADDDADDNVTDVDDDDATEMQDAIAKGGTRVAARRGRSQQQRRQAPRVGGVPEEIRRAMLDGPPRTMLVTAQADRTQIAVLEDRSIVEHYVTRKDDITYVGNIYMARVQNVLPGMEAAFLDIGKGRNGVLYAGEVLYDELDLEEGDEQRIENALKPGQKVLVQVTKDPMGTKGPRLTMHLSLAGRYMVLAPGADLFGISRKLTDRERDRLRKIVKRIKPDEHGVIVRTAAEGATDEQLTADLERLLNRWNKAEEAAAEAKALDAVYEEPPLVVKVIRDNFGAEFIRCIVDDEDLYHQVRSYLTEVAPELLDKVELYGQPTADAAARAAGAPPAEIPTGRNAIQPDTGPSAAAAGATRADATTAGSDVAGRTSTSDNGAAAGDATADTGRGTDTESEDAADETTATGSADGGASTAITGNTAAETGGLVTIVIANDPEAIRQANERRAELPPLFDAYDVADQLRKAMSRKVWLPSGGYLIVESTEAMKVIDVNTGKFTGDAGTNLEEVVLKTNLEAAEEIVRQLRLRDMGGIIIIDFIDMLLKANQDQVVRRLKRELFRDRTKTRVSEVSRLGLVQMTRKNVSQGLVEAFSKPCEVCEGRGLISELD